jgi:hypothetical protein
VRGVGCVVGVGRLKTNDNRRTGTKAACSRKLVKSGSAQRLMFLAEQERSRVWADYLRRRAFPNGCFTLNGCDLVPVLLLRLATIARHHRRISTSNLPAREVGGLCFIEESVSCVTSPAS